MALVHLEMPRQGPSGDDGGTDLFVQKMCGHSMLFPGEESSSVPEDDHMIFMKGGAKSSRLIFAIYTANPQDQCYLIHMF